MKKLKDIKLKSRQGEGWVYIGRYIKDGWEKQRFWFKEANITKLKGNKAIALNGIKIREKPSPCSKEIEGIHIGSMVTIVKTSTYQKEEETYVWAYIKL